MSFKFKIHTSDVIFNEELDMTELAGYRLIEDDLFSEFSDQNYFPNSSIESSISQPTNSTNTEPSTNTEESNYVPSEDSLPAQQAIGLMDINHIVDSDDEEDRRQEEVIQELDRKYQHLWEANNVLDISTKRLLECLNSTQDPAIPSTYEEAINGKDSAHWIAAMDREMNSIRNAKTYVVKRPHKSKLKKKPINNRWVYTLKRNKKGEIIKYKGRLVAKGYTQKKGIDYFETFAPVAKFKSIRTLAALNALLGLKAYQDDVPTAFLKGELEEEVWMEQPKGYEEGNPEEMFCELLKTLYGLRAWSL